MFLTASWKYCSGFLNLKLPLFQDSLYYSEETPTKQAQLLLGDQQNVKHIPLGCYFFETCKTIFFFFEEKHCRLTAL